MAVAVHTALHLAGMALTLRDAFAHADSHARHHAYVALCLEASHMGGATDHSRDKRHAAAWQSRLNDAIVSWASLTVIILPSRQR